MNSQWMWFALEIKFPSRSLVMVEPPRTLIGMLAFHWLWIEIMGSHG